MPDWPHAPVHRLGEAGAYVVTAGTYGKEHRFARHDRLRVLHDSLLELAAQYGWRLQAWAVFSNHYHFVALSPEDPGSLRRLVQHLHSVTAREANRLEATPGRQVWHEYWETRLTFERSYLARLNYVHQNAVRHGLVRTASEYAYCSAGWFEQRAERAFHARVSSLKTDGVQVPDPFAPVWDE